MDVTVTGIVPGKPEDVFAYISDPTKWPEWHTDMKEVAHAEGPQQGVGATYRYTAKAGGMTLRSTIRVRELEPGRRIAWEGPWEKGVRPLGAYSVEATPGGARWTARLTPETRGLMRLFEPMMARMVRKQNEDALRRLQKRAP